MKGLHETEIKIGISDRERAMHLIDRCREATHGIFHKEHQVDEYYDTIQKDLKEKDLIVRLRRTNEDLRVTLKSPRVFITETIQQRIELELDVPNEDRLRQMIEGQGLIPSVRIEKYRWNFDIMGSTVSIDELPFIGWFVEIEGPSQAAIHQAMDVLDLSEDDAVKEHYGELLTSKFRALNLTMNPILEATFEAYQRYKLHR